MQSYFFIKFKKEHRKVNYEDIVYVEAKRNYVKIVTTNGSYLCLATMVQVQTILPKDEFCRIHRSYIVRINGILSFEREKVFVEGNSLPIGDHYWKELLHRLPILNCGSADLIKMKEPSSYAMTG